MKKYAIVPINSKQTGDSLYVRCVLIQYKKKVGTNYMDTLILDESPYFLDHSNALQYRFDNDGYTLLHDAHEDSAGLIDVKRPYHSHEQIPGVDDRLYGKEFKADNGMDAIKVFRKSELYDCDSNPIQLAC